MAGSNQVDDLGTTWAKIGRATLFTSAALFAVAVTALPAPRFVFANQQPFSNAQPVITLAPPPQQPAVAPRLFPRVFAAPQPFSPLQPIIQAALIPPFQDPLLGPSRVSSQQPSLEQFPPVISRPLIQQFQAPALGPSLIARSQDSREQFAAQLTAPLQVAVVSPPVFGRIITATPQIPPVLQPVVWDVVIQPSQAPPLGPMLIARGQDSREQFGARLTATFLGSSTANVPRQRPAYHPSYQPGRGRSITQS